MDRATPQSEAHDFGSQERAPSDQERDLDLYGATRCTGLRAPTSESEGFAHELGVNTPTLERKLH